jgi:hypothetical protein
MGLLCRRKGHCHSLPDGHGMGWDETAVQQKGTMTVTYMVLVMG